MDTAVSCESVLVIFTKQQTRQEIARLGPGDVLVKVKWRARHRPIS